MGYDVTKECIPVVPAQHYFMGGVWVDHESHTSMEHLYAVGETACNGVHGRNRLASNSLLESLVFAKRAAKKIERQEEAPLTEKAEVFAQVHLADYEDTAKLQKQYQDAVREAIKEADRKMNAAKTA